jgi:putative phosphoribosyl transferase
MWIDTFLFLDRTEAGERLALKLGEEPLIKKANPAELLVLSIPRGGVVIGAAVAKALACAHEVIIAKKVGFPGRAELAIGALAEDGAALMSELIQSDFGDKTPQLAPMIERARLQVQAYIEKFRQGRALELPDRIVILVDDGMATGETMKAAVRWVTAGRPQKVIVAVPVCALSIVADMTGLVDRFIYLAIPEHFIAVSQFYWDFDPVSDEQVLAYLAQASRQTQ